MVAGRSGDSPSDTRSWRKIGTTGARLSHGDYERLGKGDDLSIGVRGGLARPVMETERSSVEEATAQSGDMVIPVGVRSGGEGGGVTPQPLIDERGMKELEDTVQLTTWQGREVQTRKKRRKREVGADCSNEDFVMIGRPGPVTRSRARKQALAGL